MTRSVPYRASDSRNDLGAPKAACLVGIAVGVAVILRLLGIQHHSLWLDEAWSVEVARNSWSSLVDPNGYRDIHPPLWFMALKPFVALAEESPELRTFWLRLPALLMSAALPIAVYNLGASLFNRRVGTYAALAAACSSYAVFYGQQCRMYAMAMLLVTWQVTLAVRLCRGRATLGNWVWMFVVSTAAALTQWFAVAVWPALVVYVLLNNRRPGHLACWLVLGTVVAAIVWPYYQPRMTGEGFDIATGADEVSPHGAGDAFDRLEKWAATAWILWTGYGAGPIGQSIREVGWQNTLAGVWLSVATILLLGTTALGIAARSVLRVMSSQILFLVLWATLLVALPIVLTGDNHSPRYAFAALPACLVLFGVAVQNAPSGSWRKVLVITALVAQLWCTANRYLRPHLWGVEYVAAADYLRHRPNLSGSVLTSLPNKMILDAYGVGRWTGQTYPHWSPQSDEVMAWVLERKRNGGSIAWIASPHTTPGMWPQEQVLLEELTEHFGSVTQTQWRGISLWTFE